MKKLIGILFIFAIVSTVFAQSPEKIPIKADMSCVQCDLETASTCCQSYGSGNMVCYPKNPAVEYCCSTVEPGIVAWYSPTLEVSDPYCSGWIVANTQTCCNGTVYQVVVKSCYDDDGVVTTDIQEIGSPCPACVEPSDPN